MQKRFFIKENGRYKGINASEINYVEGCGNYVKIVTNDNIHLVLISMKRIEQILPDHLFKRVHRSFIVSIDKILSFDSATVYLKERELSIGQQYRGELEKAVVVINDPLIESKKEDAHFILPVPYQMREKIYLEADKSW